MCAATKKSKSLASEKATESYYSEYITDRQPTEFGNRLIEKWHLKLLKYAIRQCRILPGDRFLEIGPGHGQLAVAVLSQNLEYVFVDMSDAVHQSMTLKGFLGFKGNLAELPDSYGVFDVIWMSHVLEHSPTWVEAREMVQSAASRLSANGRIIIISPDILSSREEFWASDFSHGYPTSIRNVVQLMSDVGLSIVKTSYHRSGLFGILARTLPALIARVPHSPIDAIISPARKIRAEGFFYSWKTVFGWRQIFVAAGRKTENH